MHLRVSVLSRYLTFICIYMVCDYIYGIHVTINIIVLDISNICSLEHSWLWTCDGCICEDDDEILIPALPLLIPWMIDLHKTVSCVLEKFRQIDAPWRQCTTWSSESQINESPILYNARLGLFLFFQYIRHSSPAIYNL